MPISPMMLEAAAGPRLADNFLGLFETRLRLVMIDTEAHKAIDVFYVTYERKKLDVHLQESLREDLVSTALGS